MRFCAYGCGAPGPLEMTNGKRCCQSHYTPCPAVKQRIKSAALKRGYFFSAEARKKSGETRRYKLDDILAGKHPTYSSYKLLKRLLKQGRRRRVCERCERTTWAGEPIPLELHHRDGNAQNHCCENLSLLCPNCHALAEHYRGKNKAGSGKRVTEAAFVQALRKSKNIRQALIRWGLSPEGGNYQRANRLVEKYKIF